MSFQYLNSENRQHINLSSKAFSVIQEDMHRFKIGSMSGFINRIICNFKDEANASIILTLNNKRNEWNELFKNINSPIIHEVIDLLEKDLKSELREQAYSYDIGVPIKFRINNENKTYLMNDPYCNEDSIYGNQIGKYLKALVEEYASKTYLERELIYYKQEFHIIQESIDKKSQLKVKLQNKQKIFHIKPYKITTDSQGLYHYLIACPVETSASIKCYSYRISNFISISLLNAKSSISKNTKKEIEDELSKKGAQFMSSNSSDIKIKLTDNGVRKYNNMQHLRPKYKDIIDQNIYIFDCTETQIEFYFFKFGSDAIIVEPKSLHDKFCAMYKEAYQAYEREVL